MIPADILIMLLAVLISLPVVLLIGYVVGRARDRDMARRRAKPRRADAQQH
jgi:heme/copper-type cytochrome/quinol oxidase subunit 2